jgi:hypothetical protein
MKLSQALFLAAANVTAIRLGLRPEEVLENPK